jgi:hypothetical protein
MAAVDPDESRQTEILVVAWTMTGLAIFTVGVKLFALTIVKGTYLPLFTDTEDPRKSSSLRFVMLLLTLHSI